MASTVIESLYAEVCKIENPIFFQSKCSLAFNENLDILNFESWLNSIKESRGCQLFKESNFRNLSDRILNSPLFFKSATVATRDLAASINFDDLGQELYPYEDSKIVIEVFSAIHRLIKSDLSRILENSDPTKLNINSESVVNVVELSLILVRYLARIDADRILSDHSVSKLMAQIYNDLLPFSRVSNGGINMTNESISQISLVLTQLCSTPLRNSEAFIQHLPAYNSVQEVSTRCLTRFHWFMTQMYHVTGDISKNTLADEIYNIGFPYYPIEPSESECLKFLIEADVIPSFNPALNLTQNDIRSNGDFLAFKFDEISVAVQFSSGRICVDGFPVIDRSHIINSEIFQAYFSNPEDYRLASKGHVHVVGELIVYKLDNFKAKDNHLVLLSKSSSDECYLYRKFGSYWYSYVEPVAASVVLERLNFSNFVKTELYQRINRADSKRELLIISVMTQKTLIKVELNYEIEGEQDCSEDDAEDVYGESEVKDINVEPEIEVDEFEENNERIVQIFTEYNNDRDVPWILLEEYIVDDRIDSFKALNSATLFMKDENDRLIVMFSNYFLESDLNNPLIIREIDGNEFEILNSNSKGTIVERDQSIDGSFGLSGTLKIRNGEGNTFILVPRVCENDEVVLVEIVPILNFKLAPISRLQRFTLIYYCIAAFEYRLALELLHPKQSIHMNEPLSVHEFLTIKEIITNLMQNNPESSALKLMTYQYILQDKKKFPLAAKGPKMKFNFKLFIDQLAKNYLMSVREMSEKYYYFNLFPDVILGEEQFFSNFGAAVEIPTSSYIDSSNMSYKYTLLEYFRQSNKMSVDESESEHISFDFKALKPEVFRKILQKSVYNPQDEELNFVMKMLHRRSDSKLFISTLEGMFYYSLKNTSLPAMFLNTDSYRTYDIFSRVILKELSKIQNLSDEELTDHFNGINLSRGSQATALEKIRTSLCGSFKSALEPAANEDQNYDHNEQIEPVSIVTQNDEIQFENLSKVLRRPTIKAVPDVAVKKEKEIFFSYEIMSMSPVLSKLNESMNAFSTTIENDLSINCNEVEVENQIHNFLVYLEERIETLKLSQFELLQWLIFKSKIEDLDFVSSSVTTSTASHYLEKLHKILHDKKKVKLFSDLYSCYFKTSLTCFHTKFPHFTSDELKELWRQTGKFYSTQVFQDYLLFVKELIVQLQSDYFDLNDNGLLFDELKKIHDFNERLSNPTILNFEFKSKQYRLRREQVHDLKSLTTIDPSTALPKSIVLQRMMAAGKTLVLGTNAVVSKALTGNVLSILVPPSSLYQSNTSAMQTRTYNYFKSEGRNFYFPRFSSSKDTAQIRSKYLSDLVLLLEDTIKTKNYLILSPESLQSFLNSFIEFLYLSVFPSTVDSVDVLRNFAKIYRMFRTKSSIILDEIDMTMDPRKELNYPTDRNEPYNMHAVILLTDIIEFMTFDQDIKQAGLDILGNNQTSLTKGAFTVCREIIFKYITKELESEGSLWYKLLLKPQLAGLDSSNILQFLTNPDIKFMSSWIKSIHEKESSIVADALIIVKVQLYAGIEDALKATVNLNYGVAGSARSDIFYAVPYVAANTPSASSVFADRWEVLLKTLIMTAASSCTTKTASNLIVYLRTNIIKEVSGVGSESLENTSTWKNFKLLCPGINPIALTEAESDHVHLVHEALKERSPIAIRLLFSYLVDEVLSKMTFAVEQITSNALNMTSMFGSIQGYSGTIDNVNILPRQVVEQAYEDHLRNEKHNGGISLKLIKDSQDSLVPELTTDDFKLPLDQLIHQIFTQFPDNLDRVSALIDTGAFLKNHKNIQVARSILLLFKDRIDVVIYYDEESNQLEFLKRPGDVRGFITSTDPESLVITTQTAIERRFTFYDQRHTTGSDIVQPKMAHAIMTVDTRILLRDILQGALRMRLFMSTQQVHLITSESTRKFALGETLTKMKVSNVLVLGAINEDRKEVVENEKLAFMKIDNEFRRIVLDEIAGHIENSTRNNIYQPVSRKRFISCWFKYFIDLFIRDIHETPLSWLTAGELGDPTAVLHEYFDSKVKLIEKVEVELNIRVDRKIIEEIKEMISGSGSESKNPKNSLISFLPDRKITKRSEVLTSLGTEVQVQIESQNHNLALVNVDLSQIVDQSKGTNIATDYDNFHLNQLNPTADFDEPDESANDTEHTTTTTTTTPPLISLAKLFERVQSQTTNSLQRQIAQGATLTDGKRIGIDLNLVRGIVSNFDKKFYQVFSKFSIEGTHILVQRCYNSGTGEVAFKVMLLSQLTARIVMKEIPDYAGETVFWLCDLSGRVTVTNEDLITKSTANILDSIPVVRNLFFDALIFNGSFGIILSNEHLKFIYENHWTAADEDFSLRAKYLLLRMQVLMDKRSKYFAIDDENLRQLELMAQENRVEKLKSGSNSTSSAYSKPFSDYDYLIDSTSTNETTTTTTACTTNVTIESILEDFFE